MRAVAFFLVLAAASAAVAGVDLDPELEKAVREASRWVARQAKPVAEGREGVLFPEYAEVPDERELHLYAGSAGVLIFLENAAKALDDEDLRRLADRTAAGIQGALEGAPASRGGLYVGVEGIAHAFAVRGRLREDAEALKTAVRLADLAVAREQARPNGTNDVIGGLAGTILAFLEVADATGERRFRDEARRLAKILAERGREPEGAEGQLFWRSREDWERHYPHFSHGTSGVAYALARVAAVTGDESTREAAIAGASWLVANGLKEDGTLNVFHYEPG